MVDRVNGPGDPPSDTTRVSSKYKTGDWVNEDDFEKAHKDQHGIPPQLSVQDYSKVKTDDKGNYVVKLKEGEIEE